MIGMLPNYVVHNVFFWLERSIFALLYDDINRETFVRYRRNQRRYGSGHLSLENCLGTRPLERQKLLLLETDYVLV